MPQTLFTLMIGMQRAPWLDWLRFMAAFMVMACHARGSNWVAWSQLSTPDQNWLTKVFFSLTRAGMEWVVVFFVLSGFLVGGGVIRKTREGRFDLPQFALDRATRIWVPLLPALLFSAAVATACGLTATCAEFAGNMLGLQGVAVANFAHNEPLWSLSYEIWFYVGAGALAAIFSRRASVRLAAIMALFATAYIFTKLSPWFLVCWTIGALSIFAGRWPSPKVIAPTALCMALVGAALSQLQSGTNVEGIGGLSAALPSRELALVVESLGIGLLVSALVRLPPSGQVMISLEAAGPRLAAFSYTLYLVHYPVLGLWEHFGPAKHAGVDFRSFFCYAAEIASCFAVSLVLYFLFESRTAAVRQWLRQLARRIAGTPD